MMEAISFCHSSLLRRISLLHMGRHIVEYEIVLIHEHRNILRLRYVNGNRTLWGQSLSSEMGGLWWRG